MARVIHRWIENSVGDPRFAPYLEHEDPHAALDIALGCLPARDFTCDAGRCSHVVQDISECLGNWRVGLAVAAGWRGRFTTDRCAAVRPADASMAARSPRCRPRRTWCDTSASGWARHGDIRRDTVRPGSRGDRAPRCSDDVRAGARLRSCGRRGRRGDSDRHVGGWALPFTRMPALGFGRWARAWCAVLRSAVAGRADKAEA